MKRSRHRLRGLYWRQVAITVGQVATTLALLGVSFYVMGYTYARSQKTGELLARAESVSSLSSSYLKTGQYLSMDELQQDQEFRRLAISAAVISEIDILVCDTQGRILLSTDEEMAGKSLTLPEAVMRQVEENGSWSGVSRLGEIYDKKRFVGAVYVTAPSAQEALGAVFTVSDTSSIDQLWQAFAALMSLSACLVLLVSFLISSVVSRRYVQPIRDMAQATGRYAQGDFDVRIDYRRDDELGDLAASFNTMADTLQQTERQRREFIANLSHELKTPMTSIAGCTDGILDGTIPREQQGPYLQIISDECRRLSRLVRRMLDVSALQAADPLKAGGRFDLCEAMRRVLISMERKITDRGLDVEADIPDEAIAVLGDTDMITQVIYNLLENAAKFAKPGSTLYLGVRRQEDKAEVSVRNTGDTIPAEELPLLFERFHKSDKSRSEDKDGYGLGLYIVKTILQQHKEDITVTSRDGVTTFTFRLSAAE